MMSTLQKMIRFVPSYAWLRFWVFFLAKQTFLPITIKWRWRHPYSWRD